MKFGLMIIGDEIVQGNRQDAHFAAIKQLLALRGLRLAWVEYVCDDRADLVARLRRSFAADLPVFVTGGIGSTPDDHTRQAAAIALNLPMQLHPEAVRLIDVAAQARGEVDLESATHQQRRQMACFAAGATLIPNPFNGIAGFSLHQHYFVPGFPVMAHPMLAWVLETYFAEHFHQNDFGARSAWVYDLQESQFAPCMAAVERAFGVVSYSLPSLAHHGVSGRYCVELGVKAEGAAVAQLDAAWADLLAKVRALGGVVEVIEPDFAGDV